MSNIIGSNFGQVKFQRKNRVTPLRGFASKVKIHEEEIPVSPDIIFRRISYIKKSDEEFKKYFEFELAPYPLSIFDEKGMRKTKKLVFYDLFNPVTDVNFENAFYLIDGGFLLHRVVWQTREQFSSILNKYVDYVKQYYKSGATIVFNGYPNHLTKSTKSAERYRRARRYEAANVLFDETMCVTMSQEQFLSNDANKQRLIFILQEKLENENFIVKQAVEDADTLIVRSAIELSNNTECVFMVGEDIDL